MTIRYFKKIKNRVTRLEWLTERVSIDTEYDEDADAGIIGGSITFKDGSIFHFKKILLGKNSHYRFHYMDERNNLICRWDTAPHYKNLKTFPYHVHLPDGVKAKEKAVDCFDIEKVAGQYAELYREALGWEIKAERIENRRQRSVVRGRFTDKQNHDRDVTTAGAAMSRHGTPLHETPC